MESSSHGVALQPFAPHKMFLASILGACTYSAWSFRSRGRAAVAGLVLRAALAGGACGALSLGYFWWDALQARRHAESLERLYRTADTVKMIKIDTGGAMQVPTAELDAATGQNALEANAELFRQLQLEERSGR